MKKMIGNMKKELTKEEKKIRETIDEGFAIKDGDEVFNKTSLKKFVVREVIYNKEGACMVALILDYPGPHGGYAKVLPGGYVLNRKDRFERRFKRHEDRRKYLERQKRREEKALRYAAN